MENTIIIGVYGTLKGGMSNHSMVGDDAVHLGKTRVPGMLVMQNGYGYPHLLWDNQEDLTTEVELWEVSAEAYDSIRAMEIGAGYYEQEFEKDGVGVFTVFYARRPIRNQFQPITSYNPQYDEVEQPH